MNGLRSVTLWTRNLEETETFYKDVLGLNTLLNDETNMLHVGDAHLAPGTRIIFKKYQGEESELDTHFHSICLRVPTDYALYEYKQQFDKYEVKYESVQQLNGKHLFKFYDNNGHAFQIISDEGNSGVPLGTAYDNGPISPIHQIQGIGPVMIKSPETKATGTLLKNIFKLQMFAEYKTMDDESALVFKIGAGGNGGELHLIDYPKAIESLNPPIERVAISIDDLNLLEEIVNQVKELEIEHHIIQHEAGLISLFIRDITGIIITITLDTVN
nr:VOC family protein [Mammaliicoccus sp. Marseille-Q6498]